MSFLQAVISSFSHLGQEDLQGVTVPKSVRLLLSLGGKGTDGQISKIMFNVISVQATDPGVGSVCSQTF